jgi:hypothetical protein
MFEQVQDGISALLDLIGWRSGYEKGPIRCAIHAWASSYGFDDSLFGLTCHRIFAFGKPFSVKAAVAHVKGLD